MAQLIQVLLSFSVSNFRSFDGEQTFSLVAGSDNKEHWEHTAVIPDSDERALRGGILYGANGAGKSNLFKALALLKRVAGSANLGKNTRIPRDAFRFGSDASKPTVLDAQFIVTDRVYRYGVKLDDSQVLEEWLVRVVGDQEQTIYERKVGPAGDVQVELGSIEEGNDKFASLAKVGGLRNQSFLGTVFSTLEIKLVPPDLFRAWSWFESLLELVPPTPSLRDLTVKLARDPEFLRFAGQFLRDSSTGVAQLSVIENAITEEEYRATISKSGDRTAEIEVGPFSVHGLPNGEVVAVKRGAHEPHYFKLQVQGSHATDAGEAVTLDLKEESDGTRRLLELIPVLHTLKDKSRVFFIDEVDRSLHPILVRHFLEYFLGSCRGEYRQLIMTTHESSLLDLDLLRRDEIWFAEKDSRGATSLYPLIDFKERSRVEVRKHYLQGRFGAVPFLGGAKRLIDEESLPA